MNEMMEYQGYHGSIKYNKEDGVLHGKVEFIRDLIAYHGKSVKEIEKNFKDTVDDYLLTCKQAEKEPDRPFKGSFNIRISEDLHRAAYCFAVNSNISLNEVVSKALKTYLDKRNQEGNTKIFIVQQAGNAEETPQLYDVATQMRKFDELVGGKPESFNLKGEKT